MHKVKYGFSCVCIFFLLRLCVRVHVYEQGIGIVKWDYNGTLGSAVGVRVHVCVHACGCVGGRAGAAEGRHG